LAIRFAEPDEDTAVHNVIQGHFEITGRADEVHLLVTRGEETVPTLLPEPYYFAHDVSGDADGSVLRIQGWARRGTDTAESEDLSVTVDRSLPPEFYVSIHSPPSGTVVDQVARLSASLLGPLYVGAPRPTAESVLWRVDDEPLPELGCTNSTFATTGGCITEWDTSAARQRVYSVAVDYTLEGGDVLESAPIHVGVYHPEVNSAFAPFGTAPAVPASEEVYEADFAVDASSRPVIAYRRGSGEVLVRRYDAATDSFPVLDGALTSSGLWPRLSFGPANEPAVTWTESSVSVSQWQGTTWSSLGSLLGNYSLLAHDPTTGAAVVTWMCAGTPGVSGPAQRACVSRSASATPEAGASWEALGAPLGSDLGETSWVAPNGLAVSPTGRIVVGYNDVTGDTPDRMFVQSYEGGTWTSLGRFGGTTPPGNGDVYADFAFAADGTLYVATHGVTGGITVRRRDGDQWQRVGSTLRVNELGRITTRYGRAHLVLDRNGLPIVAFSTSFGGRARRWTGSEWQDIGAGMLEPRMNAASVLGLGIDANDRLYVLVKDSASLPAQNVTVRWHQL
jgi:hypothetical protein